MHVILISSNLHEVDLVSFRNSHADLFRVFSTASVNTFLLYFGGHTIMVEEERLIVSPEDMFGQSPILLHATSHSDAYGKGTDEGFHASISGAVMLL